MTYSALWLRAYRNKTVQYDYNPEYDYAKERKHLRYELREQTLEKFSRSLKEGTVSAGDLEEYVQLLGFKVDRFEKDVPISLHIPVDEDGFWRVNLAGLRASGLCHSYYCLFCDSPCFGHALAEHGAHHHGLTDGQQDAGPLAHMDTKYRGALLPWLVGCATELMTHFNMNVAYSALNALERWYDGANANVFLVTKERVAAMWLQAWDAYWVYDSGFFYDDSGFFHDHTRTVFDRSLEIARAKQLGGRVRISKKRPCPE